LVAAATVAWVAPGNRRIRIVSIFCRSSIRPHDSTQHKEGKPHAGASARFSGSRQPSLTDLAGCVPNSALLKPKPRDFPRVTGISRNLLPS
jgi:hypothetical protein